MGLLKVKIKNKLEVILCVVSICLLCLIYLVWSSGSYSNEITLEPLGVVYVTYYNPVPEQTDSTPYKMASGHRVYEGALAVSQDFLKETVLIFGDKIYIEGLNDIMTVEDCMNIRHIKSMDILSFDNVESREFGRQKRRAYIVRKSSPSRRAIRKFLSGR